MSKLKAYHAEEIGSVLVDLSTSTEGLSSAEAATRLQTYGPNELTAKERTPLWKIFLSQFKDFMVIILLIAALISAFVAHEVVDAIVIMILVLANAIIGTVQEVKAQDSLDALEKMSAPNAKVLRDGEQKVIPARELVPGDVTLLDAGDSVPADLRLFESASLKINESALTGESVPVEKATDLCKEDAGIGDQLNMAFSSSLVTYGRGRGVVVKTGMDTEVGKIATMIQDAPETLTPMQKRLDAVGKTLGTAALVVCAIMFGIGMLYGKAPLAMFMSAIALAVAAIPEGLPTISTMVLALGVQRMAKRNAIVRTLPSVETLGSATVICSDKTGTLTQNRMTVLQYAHAADAMPSPASELTDGNLLRCAVLCSDAQVSETTGAIGDPTEIALVELGLARGGDKTVWEAEMPRVAEIPFDSERKRMTTVQQLPNGKYAVYVKGGMDEILAVSNRIETKDGAPVPIDDTALARLNTQNEEMAKDALRVLAFAGKTIDRLPNAENAAEDDVIDNYLSFELESGLTFYGMVGMIDPPRPEAKLAVAECHSAGIKPVMITGDHRLTAAAIARELDILRDGDRVVTGAELEAMSDDELYGIVDDVSVYARVSPEHKVRIVDAWQRHGDIVAMTGDGVNDAPALKRADIGCAMGQGGTDVAKDASDLILVDDNFATVVSAVEEGRRIYDNVLKSISFLLSCNIGEIITLFVATLFNWHEPLTATHLLLVNLVTDGLPALALGVDPPEPDIMKRQAEKSKGIFSKGLIWRMAYQGVMVGVLTLIAYLVGTEWNPFDHAGMDLGQAQTMAFVVLAMSQIFHSFNIRSSRYSITKVRPWENMKLVGAGLLSTLVVVTVVNVPGLNNILDLEPLNMAHMFEAVLLSITPVIVVELMKLFKLNTTKEERIKYAQTDAA